MASASLGHQAHTMASASLGHQAHTMASASLGHQAHTMASASLGHQAHTMASASLGHQAHTMASASLGHQAHTMASVSLGHQAHTMASASLGHQASIGHQDTLRHQAQAGYQVPTGRRATARPQASRVAQPVLVCAVLLGLLTQTPAASPPDEGPPISIQDIVSFLDYLQNKGINLDLASSKEHGFIKGLQDFPESSDELRANEFNDQDGNLSMEKRASYMTLCHFKICNMGRKRGFIRKSTHNFLRRL